MAAKGSGTAAGSSRTKEPRKKKRDDLILDAVERLLAKQSMNELDVEPIAAEAGITRTRFYHYYKSKHDALAGLLQRLGNVLRMAYEHPDSWFIGRPKDQRPREALQKTIDIITNSWWPHRFVLREASDLWTAVPEVRDAWLEAIAFATKQVTSAIERERELGVAPPGHDARFIAEALIWQSERIYFRAYAQLKGAMSKTEAKAVTLEIWMRTIFLADDPEPISR